MPDAVELDQTARADVRSIRSSFRRLFGEDLTVGSLDRALARACDADAARRFVETIHQDTLDELGILEWGYCNALCAERADMLESTIKKRRGIDYFHYLQTAYLFAARIQSSTEWAKISAARKFFVKYDDLHLSPFQLRGCRNVEQMEHVLSLQRRIAGGDLRRFYDEGTTLLTLPGCTIRARKGMWEAVGGTSLLVCDGDDELVAVSGFFRWREFQPDTTIVSIQGTHGHQAEQRRVRELLGLHPANVTLLLFLQLSRLFEQKWVRIRSSASLEYNVHAEDSALYRIPRNHFRLRVNPDNGLYEFDAARRDQILDKFAKRYAVLAEAFASLTVHLKACAP